MLALERRSFLTGAGALFMTGLTSKGLMAASSGDMLLASACRFPSGAYGAILFNEAGQIVQRVDLPDRGHDVVFTPDGSQAVAFARRPGNFAVAFPASGIAEPVMFRAPAGRHFFGHGAFSTDGRLLYATENAFEAGTGRIGLYDVTAGFARIGEFDSHGTGPHELLLMPGGRALAICNGGIETHPDTGRAMLNIATMRPNIAFVDARDGSLVAKLELPPSLHKLSLRHMAALPDGSVIFGGQYEGEDGALPPLAGRAHPLEGIALFPMDDKLVAGMRNYVGSVAVSRDGEEVAIASPRGNLTAILSARDGSLIETFRLNDGCGLAYGEDGLLVSTGEGVFGSPERPHPVAVAFDNHLAIRS